MKILARTFVNESKLRQKSSVELSRHFHVFHPQIDVIKATRFHIPNFNLIAAQFNRACQCRRTILSPASHTPGKAADAIGRARHSVRAARHSQTNGVQRTVRPTERRSIQLRNAPESVSAFLSWLPARASDQSPKPYPARNVQASSAHWEFAG